MEDLRDPQGRQLSRRAFIRAAGVAGAGFALYAYTPEGTKQALAVPIAGGTLDPFTVPKFVTPMLVPPVMPRAGTIKLRGGKPADYYEISVRQITQQILPGGLPPTTVWGYGAVTSENKKGLRLHHAPSLTIESKWNRPVRVKWINGLIDANGDYLPHLLPVDQTLHWANPPGGVGGRDSRPTVTVTPGPYTGPVPMVTHVHGAAGVGDESDGYAAAWYLPNAKDVPPGHATHGTWYEFFAGKAAGRYGALWGPGFATFQYPNNQREATLWYHDHTLGMTRLNVYAGPAGFFLVRGGPEGAEAIVDRRSGKVAVLPGPAPREGDKFPSNKRYYEIPIAVQDRAFNRDGSLFYPDSREFFDGATAEEPGFIPDTDLAPIWNPEFFGNMIMVNGNTWPYQTVEKRRYRLRFLNGCQSRFLILDFNQIPGIEVWAIGNEGGFLAAPVNLTANHGNRLLMGLAERADLIVDFTNVPVGSYVLGNAGPDEPFGGGEAPGDFDVADPDTTGQVVQFRVIPTAAPDPTTPPQFMVLPPVIPLPPETRTRKLGLVEMGSSVWDGPAEAMLGTVDELGQPEAKMWDSPVTENPGVGDTEVWEFYNFTADAHPMHVHETSFEVVNRQGLVSNDDQETVPPARLVGRPAPTRGVGERLQGHRDRLPGRGDTNQGEVRQPWPVRLALSHRRARGQRDDAALPDREAAARRAGVNRCRPRRPSDVPVLPPTQSAVCRRARPCGIRRHQRPPAEGAWSIPDRRDHTW